MEEFTLIGPDKIITVKNHNKCINTEPKSETKSEPKSETKSGFEVVMENVEKLKNKKDAQRNEVVAKNLQTFKMSYNKFKENPTDLYKHEIHIDTLTEYEMYTSTAISKFLVSEEKWPDSKISIDSKNGITVSFAIDGWFSTSD